MTALSVSAFVARGSEVLLVQVPARGWEMPGGLVEKSDSSLVAALIREVQEEAGCLIRPKHLLLIAERTGTDSVVNFLYAADYLGGTARPGAECIDARWCRREEALERVRFEPVKRRLAMCLEEGAFDFYSYTGNQADNWHRVERATRENQIRIVD